MLRDDPSNLHCEDCEYDDVVSNFSLQSDCSVSVRIVISQRTCIQSSSSVLHQHSSHGIFERLIEFTKASNHEIDQMIDWGIGFLFDVNRVDILISILFLYSEQVVDCILEDLQHFFRNELFLSSIEKLRLRLTSFQLLWLFLKL